MIKQFFRHSTNICFNDFYLLNFKITADSISHIQSKKYKSRPNVSGIIIITLPLKE